MNLLSEDKYYYIKVGKMYAHIRYEDVFQSDDPTVTLKKDYDVATTFNSPSTDARRHADRTGGKIVKIMTTVVEEEVE